MDYLRFDPAECAFPRPRVPLLPAFRWEDIGFGGNDTTDPSILDGPSVRHYSRGRYALREAYRQAGVGPAGALLAPAYHCRTMLDPALALGATVRLYEVGTSLAPVLDSVRALVASEAVPAKALVVPHYFGFEQPAAVMDELAELCGRHGISLVEDCSHAWRVAAMRASKGGVHGGRTLVASPYKFFGCEDGGTLWAGSGKVSRPAARSALDEVKALKTAWGRSRAARTSAPATARAPHAGKCGADIRESGTQPSPHYRRECEVQGMLALSHWVIRRTRLDPVIQRRRSHYLQWTGAVASLRGGRALFPDLPADCAPYMFPLDVTAPDPVFYQLKQAGVPVWRWDDMAVSACAVAGGYRTSLLHLPCHQDLTDDHMRWMIALVAQVLA